MATPGAATEPQVFDLRLPPLALEAGGRVDPHLVRGWWWGPASDLPALTARSRVVPPETARRQAYRVVRRTIAEAEDAPLSAAATSAPGFDETIPTIVAVHALTGDMRAGGPGGWWEPVIGPGKALDPARCRVLCFNNLGSCYGTSGPADQCFPHPSDARSVPSTVTTWDQARSIIAALDQLGIQRVALATGGSVGGMIALALAVLAPDRFERIAPIASAEAAGPWIIGWNHIAQEILLLDPAYPDAPARGLEIARQLAMLTYRAEPGLDLRQGRAMAGTESWQALAPYKMETYLEHQGVKLRERFNALAYLTQLGAMNHHDLARTPPGESAEPWGVPRIRASTLAVAIDTDLLYFPVQMTRLSARLRERGTVAVDRTLTSPHGHDAFLIEWDQVSALLEQALALPAFSGDDAPPRSP